MTHYTHTAHDRFFVGWTTDQNLPTTPVPQDHWNSFLSVDAANKYASQLLSRSRPGFNVYGIYIERVHIN